MALFAPVAPIQVLEEMAERGYRTFGNYHLMLAHHCAMNADRFESMIKKAHKDHRPGSGEYNTHIIMDNSVVELGGAVDDKMIREACRSVAGSPSAPVKVIPVLPDVIGDCQATIAASEEAYFRWAAGAMPHDEYMLVAQGQDLEEFCYCVDYFFTHDADKFPKIRWIGIPRRLTQYIGTRRKAIEYVHAVATQCEVHLFGFSDDFVDDILCARVPCVFGIDSAVPMRYQGMFTPTSTIPPRAETNWWEEGVFNAYAEVNLEKVRQWVGGLPHPMRR